jgi:hypothetical protein
MFEVKLTGYNELMTKFEMLDAQIRTLYSAIPDEMRHWQTEDVHRKFPSQKKHTFRNRLRVVTKFHPHSVYETRKSAEARQRRKRRKHSMPVRPRSTRPILRPALIERLHERMVKLVSEAMKWP